MRRPLTHSLGAALAADAIAPAMKTKTALPVRDFSDMPLNDIRDELERYADMRRALHPHELYGMCDELLKASLHIDDLTLLTGCYGAVEPKRIVHRILGAFVTGVTYMDIYHLRLAWWLCTKERQAPVKELRDLATRIVRDSEADEDALCDIVECTALGKDFPARAEALARLDREAYLAA